jgi:uncharacterized cupin superfamily protein
MAHPNVTHWDDVPVVDRRVGHLGGRWRDLGSAAGSFRGGVVHGALPAGSASSPLHVHGDEEEHFYILDGEGLSVQGDRAYPVRAGDCLLHRVHEAPHALVGGADGLTYLAFGPRAETNLTWLPRAGVMRVGPRWVPADVDDPYAAEAAAGPLDVPVSADERPPTIMALEDVPPSETQRGRVRDKTRRISSALGAETTGLRHVRVAPGARGTPHHCHAADEELFVVLGGAGHVRLGDELVEVRRGSVVARPPGTGVAHSFLAGEQGLEYLGWSTREPNDIAFYPDSGKVYLRGVGVIGRLEPADYWDGEDDD